MFTDDFFLNLKVCVRNFTGRAQNKKLRCVNQLTASIETLDNKIVLLSITQKQVTVLLKKKNYNTAVIRIFLNDKRYFVTIKDIQVHPYKRDVINIVFKEVLSTKQVVVNIPIVITGVKNCEALHEGSKLEQKMDKITLRCFVQSIPKCLSVNVKFLKSGDLVHIYDIPCLNDFGAIPDVLKQKLVLKITKRREDNASLKKEMVDSSVVKAT